MCRRGLGDCRRGDGDGLRARFRRRRGVGVGSRRVGAGRRGGGDDLGVTVGVSHRLGEEERRTRAAVVFRSP